METSSTLRHRDVGEPRLPAVDRALDLLETVGVSSPGLTLSEVSERLRIPISSAHYLVYTLVRRGYLQRNPRGHYFELGPQAFDFSNFAIENMELRRLTSPHTQKLSEELKLAVLTAVRRGRQGVILDVKDFSLRRHTLWPGFHFFLHATALGKALISHLSDAEIDALFEGHPLIRPTTNTIGTLGELKAHLAEVRRQGFALNNEEDCYGSKTIAAPAFNHVGEVIAAVSVGWLSAEVPDWRIAEMADKIIMTARAVTRELAT